ncbi:MAG: discoidin domain-containing protein, partial [Clostridiales bacterium]|nr:discoidin domain-containing protein [Candidatus Coliplasma caballi]
IPLAEFGGENGFTYHMAVSNKVNENICLFYPSVELPEGTGRTKVLPYAVWTSEATATEIATGSNLVFINYAGYKYATGISFILAGDKMTVAELTELGYGTAKDLNYVYTYVCDAEGNVIEEYETLGKPDGVKSDVICPEGGFILGFHGDLGKPEIDAGDKLTVHNVLIKNMRGVADNQKLTNAFVEIHKHSFELKETVAPTLAKKGYDICKCSDCGKEIICNETPIVMAQPASAVNLALGQNVIATQATGNYHTDLTDGVISNTVRWIEGEWCNLQGDNTAVVELAEVETISIARFHTLFCTNSSGISNPKSVKIEVSKDGEAYTQVAYEEYEKEPQTSGWNAIWLAYSFEPVEAKYIRFTIQKHTNFCMIDEIEVYERANEEMPTDGSAFRLTYAGLYFDAAASCVLAGDGETTVGELVALGNGKSDELAWWDVVVCDKDGIVITAVHTGGSGTTKAASMKVPEGGFAIAVHCDGVNANFKSIAVGNVITLHNVLLENMRGVEDTQKLTNSWITVHVHDFKKGDVVAPTLAKEGYTVYECACGATENRDATPVVKAQPDKLEELPDGAKTIGFAGAKYAGGVSFVLAGDNMTVKELVALGNNGAGKDLHYFFIYVVDKDGVVVEVNEHVGEVKDDALNDKSDIVCPEGGFILAVHNDCGKPTGIEVGKLLTLHNVDLNAMRGVADNQALTNAFITVKDKYLKGDINGDGAVDAFDYQMLKACVMGTYEPTEAEFERMHLTDDDEVDAFDYQLLKAVVMGQASFDEN